jgi:hypothetical protein
MKNKDLNEIAALENAIKKKYGAETIENPKNLWNKDKEEEYLKELKNFYKQKNKKVKYENIENVKIKNKKRNTEDQTICPVCSSYSFNSKDDLYMNKFDCCYVCYIQYIEGREKRWKSGWRPNS